MLDHLSIQCSDTAASAAFYDAVLAPLGGQRVMEFGPVIGYGVPPMPDFWIGPHETGDGFRESHIAFSATDREAVQGVLRRRRRRRCRGAARAASVARVPPQLLRRVRSRSRTATTSRRCATRRSDRQVAATKRSDRSGPPRRPAAPRPPAPDTPAAGSQSLVVQARAGSPARSPGRPGCRCSTRKISLTASVPDVETVSMSSVCGLSRHATWSR